MGILTVKDSRYDRVTFQLQYSERLMVILLDLGTSRVSTGEGDGSEFQDFESLKTEWDVGGGR